VDALLERLPLVYGVLAALVVLLPVPAYRALGGVGLALIGLAAAAGTVALAGAASAFVVTNEILAAAGLALIAVAVVVAVSRRSVLRGEPSRFFAEEEPAPWPGLDPLYPIGLLLAWFGPHLILLGLGAVVAIFAAGRGAVRSSRAGWLLWLGPGAGFLCVGLTIMLTILGPTGGALRTIADAPVSPPAERILVALLGLASLILSGLSPWRPAPWGLSLLPVSVVIVVRLIRPALPLGLAGWQAPAMLLLLVPLGAAAIRGRWPQLVAAGGLLALWTGRPEALLPGSILVAWGWLADLAGRLRIRPPILAGARWSAVPAVLPALAALPALETMLRSQVVVSVAAVAVIVAGFGVEIGRRSREPRPPL